ncbi:hypothetical protein A0E43_18430 [Pectobacterium cacticida]
MRGRCVTPRWVEKGERIHHQDWWPLANGCGASWFGHAAGTAPQPRRPMVAWHVADNVSWHGVSMATPRARGSKQSEFARFPLTGSCSILEWVMHVVISVACRPETSSHAAATAIRKGLFLVQNREKALHPDGWKACWGQIADRLLVQQ